MKRRKLTPRQKADIRLRQGDRCKVCGDPLPITDRSVEFDHIQALIHGGSNDLDNFRAIHADCHKSKTKADVAAKAKVSRIRRKAAERSKGITNAKQRALARIAHYRKLP